MLCTSILKVRKSTRPCSEGNCDVNKRKIKVSRVRTLQNCTFCFHNLHRWSCKQLKQKWLRLFYKHSLGISYCKARKYRKRGGKRREKLPKQERHKTTGFSWNLKWFWRMSEQKKKTWEIIWKTWEIFQKISHVFCRNSLVSIDKRWQKSGNVWRLWKQKVQNRWWARAYTHARRHILEESQHHGGDQRRLFPWLATTSQEALSHARCIKWKLLPSNDMDEQGMKSRGTPRLWQEKTMGGAPRHKTQILQTSNSISEGTSRKKCTFPLIFLTLPLYPPISIWGNIAKDGCKQKSSHTHEEHGSYTIT